MAHLVQLYGPAQTRVNAHPTASLHHPRRRWHSLQSVRRTYGTTDPTEEGSHLDKTAFTKKNTYTVATIGLVLTIVFILYPEDAFHSSVNGLRLWFDIVLPALLPFFVMAEVLMGLGVIHFIGALLEPVMRPLFRIPGSGAFAAALGLAAGYPLGAKLAGNLVRARLCTDVEGERLVSLANTADPLFMVGNLFT